MATIKIVFKNSDDDTQKQWTVLFGDSYKPWRTQFDEYMRMFSNSEVVSAYKSKSKWIGFGGLKWCSEKDFLEELTKEGDHTGKYRYYSTFEFTPFKLIPNPTDNI